MRKIKVRKKIGKKKREKRQIKRVSGNECIRSFRMDSHKLELSERVEIERLGYIVGEGERETNKTV